MKINYTYDEIRAKIMSGIEENDKLKKLTNMNSYSGWMLIVNAVARCYHYFLNAILQYIYDSIFPQSSDRYCLSRHMRDEGLTFKDAAKSTCIVRLGSKTAVSTAIPIPQGTIVKTKSNDPKCFEVTDGGTVPTTTTADSKGYFTEPFTVQAVDVGESYNVGVETIIVLENSIDGIDVVYNEAAATGGMDDESDESGYLRLVDAKNAKSRGTKTWYKSEAEKITGVKQAIIVPRYAGRGSVGIVVIGYGGIPAQDILDAVENYFNTDENDPAGAAHVIACVPTIQKQDYIITIWYDKTKGTPSDDALTSALSDYLQNLTPGTDQVRSTIVNMLINSFSLMDARIDSPTTNTVVPTGSISALGSASWNKEEWIDA